MKTPIIIGIAGGSGSGKSTVQRRILDSFGEDHIVILEHDAYYRDLSHLPFEERAVFNFDHPAALETELCVRHLDALKQGHAIARPVYDFANHVRLEETERLEPRAVIIVDGILVLAEPELRSRMDIKLFVDTADDVRLMRRIRRDLSERQRSIDSILDQYGRTVRPMHIEFVEPSKRFADVIIPGGGMNDVAMEMVLARVAMFIQS
ncbi:MAG TPA: uridine kinase [Rhodothermales bacterium]|nr:uridine kinase [Rhodothermales bacterium]